MKNMILAQPLVLFEPANFVLRIMTAEIKRRYIQSIEMG